jgi:hypothetical protein|tara:strand:- start:1505 stop:2158 length:654 start_codon:yes stop_codon:yes gene_type:complete
MAEYLMNHYTKVYDDFLDPEICDAYVSMFEETMKKDADEVKKTSICTGPVRPDGHQICGNCNCQRMNPMGFDRFDHLNALVMPKFQSAVEKYKKDVDLHPTQFPERLGWEEFRMKRFICGTGKEDDEQFGDHADVLTHEGAKRILILMVYLNDNFNGGETVFPVLGDQIKPVRGRLLMFPPTWTYLHRGNPPRLPGYAKYFLMTYLNYGNIDDYCGK